MGWQTLIESKKNKDYSIIIDNFQENVYLSWGNKEILNLAQN